jgi:endonuclease/exonuclease/phosphatase family metal-dependent hydrolase
MIAWTLACSVAFAQESADVNSPEEKLVRVATYNVSLYGKRAGEVRERLKDGRDRQAENIAAVVQTVRPDILLLNEIDFDTEAETATMFAEKYLAVGRGKRVGIDYPFIYAAASNTGLSSSLDLNNNGMKYEPNDAWGYGVYPGQYAMAVFSRFPIEKDNIRTFQKFLWKDLPGAIRPMDPETNAAYYNDETWSQLRLSSKNHIDVPVRIGGSTVHVLASHPTPPVFDGPEDRNGCRNHDEIRFWNLYLSDLGADQLVDDLGVAGGLASSESFIIMGDLNADPHAGDGRRDAIRDVLAHARVQDPRPQSQGAVEEAQQKGVKDLEKAKTDTANFGRNGNMRADYVLPSRDLKLVKGGVFWPRRDQENRDAISASDHRLVWIDVTLTEPTGDHESHHDGE